MTLLNSPVFTCLFFVMYTLHVGSTTAQASGVNIYVNADGVYRINRDQLSQSDSPVRFDELNLKSKNLSKTFWVNDDGDGIWENGESIDFLGEHNRGKNEWFDPISITNVYQLIHGEQAQIGDEVKTFFTEQSTSPKNLYVNQHLEQNLIRAPLSADDQSLSAVSWYWHKLSATAQTPLKINFTLNSINPSEHQAIIRLKLRGWSAVENKTDDQFDHVLSIALNGKEVGATEWNGRTENIAEFNISSAKLSDGINEIQLSVLNRKNAGHDIIDLLYLDWIELETQHSGQLSKYTELITSEESYSSITPKFDGFIYGSDINRMTVDKTNESLNFPIDQKVNSLKELIYVPKSDIREALYVRTTKLLSTENITADYLIISHPAFIKELTPLIQWHKSQGKAVLVWDSQAVYDTFNYGMFGADAINKAIEFVAQNSLVDLKHVLLVGDSNWFSHQDAQPYKFDLPDQMHNNLLPTNQIYTRYGPAASDIFYTLIDDDSMPNIAVGRFPVNNLKQLQNIINKTLSHHQNKQKGFWSSQINMLTPKEEKYQQRNQRIINGLKTDKVEINELLNESNDIMNGAQNIVNAFNQGQSLIHFYGHGGRYMWQIGQHEESNLPVLFDLTHIQQLSNEKLPIVLSMTCSSSPFDHPSSSSFSEDILLKANYGTAAVLGSTARNYPPVKFSQNLINSLLEGSTIGQALNHARSHDFRKHYIDSYVILGDPSISLNLPNYKVQFNIQNGLMNATVPNMKFNGVFKVRQFDVLDKLIQEVRFDAKQNQLQFLIDSKAASIQVYAHDSLNHLDAYGYFEINE